MLSLRVDGASFKDGHNRTVILRGINLAADSKLPATPDIPSHEPARFYDGDDVSFVNRPFSLEDAPTHFSRLRQFGFNTLRYIFTWEAIEHRGPGIYDDHFVQHTVSLLRLAGEYGFYIFMDPHQDVWSRFSGGSGAPMWTIYACGLDPKAFEKTATALVHNTYPNPEEYPKMVWPTNYYKLVCQTIFALFFAGEHFAPNAIIDGKNIQLYLQSHFFNACQYLAKKLKEANLLGYPVIGWESFNEPNKGFISYPHLDKYPDDQRLKLGLTPTGWQGLQLGMGRAVENVAVWQFGAFGPRQSGTEKVDPEGTRVWLSPNSEFETRYKWKRASSWKLGECIWAQHGVWDVETNELKEPSYFYRGPNGSIMTYEEFTNTFFNDFYKAYRDAILEVVPDAIMFCQPPVLEVPPDWVKLSQNEPNTVFAPHFYDGLTLINKSWNRWYNVDVVGVLRGRYRTVVGAVRIGETAIRNCIRDQLAALTKEGVDQMGTRPTVFTEIGIPFDMNGKAAYNTADYADQLAAMDANMFAIEGANVAGVALWTYVAINSHRWGDSWNGEDLSIFSVDDAVPSLLDKPVDLGEEGQQSAPAAADAKKGWRAIEAVVRPCPIAVNGRIIAHGFDLKSCTWRMTVERAGPDPDLTNLTDGSSTAGSTKAGPPSSVFLPLLHFPPGETRIEATGDTLPVVIELPPAGEGSSGDGPAGSAKSLVRRLEWDNPVGTHTIVVTGRTVKRDEVALQSSCGGCVTM